MRKVKLQMQLSVDGFVAGPNGELDWMVWNWDDTLKHYVGELTDSVDTMFVGAKTYKGMAAYWPGAEADVNNPERPFARKMNSLNKIVFSNTLENAEWENSRLAKKTLQEEVAELKEQEGRDIIIYGGAGIVSGFITHGLIDEYHIFINPVLLGQGKTITQELGDKLKLKLVKTTTTTVGIVILCYVPEN